MKRTIFSISFIFLIYGTLFAEVTIDKERFVQNRGTGYCGWCCLEMCCVTLGHDDVKGLTNRRENTYVRLSDGQLLKTTGASTVSDLVNELNRLKIKHKAQYVGNKDQQILKKAAADNLPVVIGVKDYPGPNDHHAVVMTALNDENVTIVDPNLSNKPVSFPSSWLNKHFMGFAVVVEPKDGKQRDGKASNETITVKNDDRKAKKTDAKVNERVEDKVSDGKSGKKTDDEVRYDDPPGRKWSISPSSKTNRVFRP